ncbi:hypothetical protein [Candidatus Nitrosocosmicus franklandus]|uniref:Uncharacterized protein n=1 Tax=Candidatus Nitrosocosmicus franklandianus TaxID=1798806 RepID=A0A484IBN6_9ARCH|nr:hypothetical protein [Candidatus Nitrosocosmicus franklandus]VFJ13637.1 protein of unknown function [Candidatus Nitrosocosmicus franklandus]
MQYIFLKSVTIIDLKRYPDNDGNYITEGLAKSSVRMRFLLLVYCIDYADVTCSVGGINLGRNTPTIECDDCGFIYPDSNDSIYNPRL